MHAAAEYYTSVGSHNDALFLVCYPFIVEDLYQGHTPAQMNTEGHLKEIWEWLPNCPLWHRKGSRTKNSRWFSWNRQAEEMEAYFGALMWLLLAMGLQAGLE